MIYLHIFLLFFVILLLLFIYKYTIKKTRILFFEGDIANTPEQKKQGLMFRKKILGDKVGMLFLMKPQKHSFWMKNTYISLDVLFLDHDMRVVGFVENTTPFSLEPISIDHISSHVLEVDSGTVKKYKIKQGDKIVFIEKKL